MQIILIALFVIISMYAPEALDCGFVNKVVENQEAVLGKLLI